jgi:sialidase-1
MSSHSVTNFNHKGGNPRNSEGAFLTLRDGRIMFAYTAYYSDGRGGDDDPANIVAVFSDDDGRTWGKERIVVVNEGKWNVMSVSLLRLQNGRIAIFYLCKNSSFDCRPWVRFSDDEGETWSEPVATMHRLGYFVLNNDRAVQLKSGRIILPLSHHYNVVMADNPEKVSIEGRGLFCVVMSDDNGATWQEGSERWQLPSGPGYLQEPGVVELADGRVWCFMRTNIGRQWQSFSSDQGETWSVPKPSRFQSPRAPMSVKRNPHTGALLAIWDDAALATKMWGEKKKLREGWLKDASWGRTPLVMAESRDEGRRWTRSRVIEDDPDHGFCYIAIHFTDEALLLGYCCGGGDDSHVLQNLRVRRIPF